MAGYLRLAAGLYKQLAELQNVLAEFREDPENNSALRQPIVELLADSGLVKDCPYNDGAEGRELTADNVDSVPAEQFKAYTDRVYRCARRVCWIAQTLDQLSSNMESCSVPPSARLS